MIENAVGDSAGNPVPFHASMSPPCGYQAVAHDFSKRRSTIPVEPLTLVHKVIYVNENSLALKEVIIDLAYGRLISASSPAARAAAWNELKSLILSRDPSQIARMESQRGLR